MSKDGLRAGRVKSYESIINLTSISAYSDYEGHGFIIGFLFRNLLIKINKTVMQLQTDDYYINQYSTSSG